MANTIKTAKGFNVTCPRCRDADATLTLDLNDLSGDILCSACDETFTVKQAIATIELELANWKRVARWLDMVSEAMAD